jgi:hypothetical protein
MYKIIRFSFECNVQISNLKSEKIIFITYKFTGWGGRGWELIGALWMNRRKFWSILNGVFEIIGKI